MSSQISTAGSRFLVDALPKGLLRDVVLVLAGSSFIALSALIIVPLPFTPVPISMATFAVMANAAMSGPVRGALSAFLYLAIGALGAPVFSNHQSGVLLPTFGYIIGYIVASYAIGQLARHRAGRRLSSALLLGAIGTFILYVCGVPWLAISLGVDAWQAITLGVLPFLVGDALKVVLLSLLLPYSWRAAERASGSSLTDVQR